VGGVIILSLRRRRRAVSKVAPAAGPT
jgi:hypothetical protein